MMITLQEAQEQLPSLTERAAAGEEVVIVKDGAPIVSLQAVPAKRKLGLLEGMYEVPEDIDTPFQKDIDDMFYGELGE